MHQVSQHNVRVQLRQETTFLGAGSYELHEFDVITLTAEPSYTQHIAELPDRFSGTAHRSATTYRIRLSKEFKVSAVDFAFLRSLLGFSLVTVTEQRFGPFRLASTLSYQLFSNSTESGGLCYRFGGCVVVKATISSNRRQTLRLDVELLGATLTTGTTPLSAGTVWRETHRPIGPGAVSLTTPSGAPTTDCNIVLERPVEFEFTQTDAGSTTPTRALAGKTKVGAIFTEYLRSHDPATAQGQATTGTLAVVYTGATGDTLSVSLTGVRSAAEPLVGSGDLTRVITLDCTGTPTITQTMTDLLAIPPSYGAIAPVITAQPVGVANEKPVAFSLAVVALGLFKSYQWFKDGVAIPGATASSFTVHESVLADSGSYSVTVSNVWGSVTSDTVTVDVSDSAITAADGLQADAAVELSGVVPNTQTIVESEQLDAAVTMSGLDPEVKNYVGLDQVDLSVILSGLELTARSWIDSHAVDVSVGLTGLSFSTTGTSIDSHRADVSVLLSGVSPDRQTTVDAAVSDVSVALGGLTPTLRTFADVAAAESSVTVTGLVQTTTFADVAAAEASLSVGGLIALNSYADAVMAEVSVVIV